MKHGGDLMEARARYGAGDPPWLDLSTGINPHSWPVPEALLRAGWERLPGAEEAARLLVAARGAYATPEGAAIVAAPGTQALIQWLARLAPPGAVAIARPSYSGHEAAWRGAGREAVLADSAWPPPPPFGRSPSPGGGGDTGGDVSRNGVGASPPPTQVGPARLGHSTMSNPATAEFYGEGDHAKHGGGGGPPNRVVVTPNNPDGRVTSLADLRAMAEDCARAGGWLIVDEAFADLHAGPGAVALVPDHPVVVLRSFGKFYGLAGLRLGFAVARPAIADALGQALGDWAVSGPALGVGAAALADREWAEAMRLRLAEEATVLERVLLAAGLAPLGGTSLYRLVRHPDAALIHERLAAAHVWCRRFAEAPDLLRFGLPPDAAGLARLAEALAHAQGTSTASPSTSAR
jgi:cobalamin biosynthetic protein CobC